MLRRDNLPATLGAVAVAAVGALSLWLVTFGPLATQMAVHIGLMSVAAPAAAVFLVRAGVVRAAGARWLWQATVVQLLLLWGAHAPAVHQAIMTTPMLQSALWAALFLSALAFWLCLASPRPDPRWREILALLLTGKLACLLAALLVFAPRPLYAVGHHAADLNDQQLAGLLMLAACPLSYIVAAIVLAVQMMGLAWGDEAMSRAQRVVRQTA